VALQGNRMKNVGFSPDSGTSVARNPQYFTLDSRNYRSLDLQVGVGTSGLGKGAFTHLKYWNDAIPEKLQPTALLEFPNKVRGGPPVKMEFALKERC
jgi:hypothetical protein